MWRNGVIVDVRNCEDPAGEPAVLRCASLYCAKAVTEILTNAQQARLTIEGQRRLSGETTIRVDGSIDQYLNTPRLPTRFECDMQPYDRAAPRLYADGRLVQ